MTAAIHVIEGRDLADIPAKLRLLADDIEKGEYGDVQAVATVVRAIERYPAVLGFGAVSSATHTFESLHLGARVLLGMLDA